ncbi:MAG: hypothetical protein Kow00124_23450 [Anaerolineae bacterium]
MTGTQNHPNDSPTTGREPQLGGQEASILSGYEPLLGGMHRQPVDAELLALLLNTPDLRRRGAVLEHIRHFGQSDIYAGALAEVIRPHARRMIGSWQAAYSPSQRRHAIQALAVIGSYESVVPLLVVLSDSIYEVREAARAALPQVCARFDPADPRTQLTYQALIDALGALPLGARKVVATILGSAPADQVLALLLRRGLTAESHEARRETAWVLGTLGDVRATRRLVDALADESASVRAAAAWALGRMPTHAAIGPLAGAASTDPDELVRAAAAEALGTHAAHMHRDDDQLSGPIDALVAALNDRTPTVREAALEALKSIDAPLARIALHAYHKRHRPGSQ